MDATSLDQLTITLDPTSQRLLAAAIITMMFAIALGLRPAHFQFLRKEPKLFFGGLAAQLIALPAMTIAIADKIIDMGPKAGKLGGKIIAEGSYEEIKKNPKSITGQYLNNKEILKPPKTPREPYAYLHLKDANLHNLKNLSLKIGVFGSNDEFNCP